MSACSARLDRGVAFEGVGRVDGAVADGDGVIEHLADHAQGALGGDVLVELLEHVIAVALRPGASRFGGVPVECNGLKGELGVSAPAVIFAAFLGITGINSVFIEKTFLLIADVAGGLERDPGIGPNALILASAVLGGREAVPPEPVLPAGGVDLKKQASAVRDPVAPRTLRQTPPLTPPQFFAGLGFAGISRDPKEAKDPLQCSGSQAVLGRSGKCRESPFLAW